MLDVKIDTKEKFSTFDVRNDVLTANMTAELVKLLEIQFAKPTPHVVLKLSELTAADPGCLQSIANIQQQFYDKGFSFVMCCLQQSLQQKFDEEGLLDIINYTPTESEAWDIVQMEEIERELFKDEEL